MAMYSEPLHRVSRQRHRGRICCIAGIALGLLLMAALPAFSAGGQEAGATSAGPESYKGITLNLLTPRFAWTPAAIEGMQRVAGSMGMTIKVTEIAFDDCIKKIILDAKSRTPSWDIVHVANIQFGSEWGAGAIANWNDFMDNSKLADPGLLAKSDWVPQILAQCNDQNGKLVVYPGLWAMVVYAYRKDLFDSPIEKAAFKQKYGYELAPAQTYTQYRDIAEFFTRPKGHLLNGQALQNDMYGTTFANAKGTFLWHRLDQILAAFDTDVMDSKGQPTWDTPKTRAAVEYYVSMAPYLPPGHLSMTGGGSCALAATGQVAQLLEFTDTLWDVVMNPAKSATADKWAVTLPPTAEGWGRPHAAHSCWGGAWGVYKYSPNKEATYKMLERFYSPEVQLEITRNSVPYLMPRLSVIRDPKVRELHPQLKIMESAENMYGHPTMTYYEPAIDIASLSVHQMLTAGAFDPKSMQTVQAQLVKMAQEYGYPAK